MGYSFILGGTKGLGLSLSLESQKRGVEPIIAGRSVDNYDVLRLFPPGLKRLAIDLNDPGTINNLWNIRDLDMSYVFWVAGIFERRSFVDTKFSEIDRMVNVHLNSPLKVLNRLHEFRFYPKPRPYHLVTIASTSSFRLRDNESLYCGLKAAKAAFTRNFAKEVIRDCPGSKVTLVNPGGLKTPNFWGKTKQDISKFMEPDVVAKLIWDEVQKQDVSFKEIQILRKDDGNPKLEYGPRLPETPLLIKNEAS